MIRYCYSAICLVLLNYYASFFFDKKISEECQSGVSDLIDPKSILDTNIMIIKMHYKVPVLKKNEQIVIIQNQLSIKALIMWCM